MRGNNQLVGIIMKTPAQELRETLLKFQNFGNTDAQVNIKWTEENGEHQIEIWGKP